MEIAVPGTDTKASAEAAIQADNGGLQHALPQALYLATLFTIPFFRWRQVGGIKVDYVLMLLLSILIVLFLMSRKTIPSSFKSNLWPWLGLFLSINLLSSMLSPFPKEYAMSGLRIFFLDFVFICINLLMVRRKTFLKTLPIIVVSSVTLNAFLAILGYFFSVAEFRVGTRGIGGTIGANNAALMGVFVIPLCVNWLTSAKTRSHGFLALACLMINILGVISTESRGGFLIMSVTLVVLALQNKNRFQVRYLGLVLAAIATCTVLAIFFTPDTYIDRISTLGQGRDADVSTQRRSNYLVVGFKSFLANPIIGTGPNTFRRVWADSDDSRNFKEAERAAHNTYLEVLVGSGILGLFFFVAVLLQSFANYHHALTILEAKKQVAMASMTRGYQVAFLSVLIYFFFKTGLDHKMFLLALPLSQSALSLAMAEPEAQPEPADAAA